MSTSSSPSKLPLSQEIENPISLNFLISPPKGYPSTPPCSPTLVLSGKDSLNSEAQSDVQPTLETPSEDLKVMSSPMSSTISEQLFEGNLPEGKGIKSDILAAVEELVVEIRSPEKVPHNAQPLFDQSPKSFGVDSEEGEKEETPLVWHRKGVRGANASTMAVSDLGAVDAIHETKLDVEPTESKKKRKRKGKGKMVESYTKGDKQRYATRGELQKMMGEALAKNEVQTEQNQRRQRDLNVPIEEPTSTPQYIGSSKIESEDIIKAVAKQRKEAEIE
ncbi:hypothetical protein KY289_011188 [Solanum tuberosum]|nr:hypothetical protein KY289_011188 [Solanum tuberosum]